MQTLIIKGCPSSSVTGMATFLHASVLDEQQLGPITKPANSCADNGNFALIHAFFSLLNWVYFSSVEVHSSGTLETQRLEGQEDPIGQMMTHDTPCKLPQSSMSKLKTSWWFQPI